MSTSNSTTTAAFAARPRRVAVYVDGLNLYYGLRSAGWRRYYWLDLWRLSENLLRPGQRLTAVHYFTAQFFPDPDDPEQHIRQEIYLRALALLPGLRIHYGYHMTKEITCPQCGVSRTIFEEKMTDVNIAVALLNDALDDAFDQAIIISADSDLAGPITAVRNRYTDKPVIAAFPPKRASKHLRRVATTSFTIGRKVISDSQLPPRLVNSDGYTIAKPAQWN